MKRTSALRHSNVRFRLLLVVLGVVVIVAGYSFWKLSQPDGSASTDRPSYGHVDSTVVVLDATIQWSRQEFHIINRSDKTWQQCKFEVNAAGFGDGYGVLLNELTSGTRTAITHSVLRKADGAVYEYATMSPMRSTIRCQNVDGKIGVYIGTPQSR